MDMGHPLSANPLHTKPQQLDRLNFLISHGGVGCPQL